MIKGIYTCAVNLVILCIMHARVEGPLSSGKFAPSILIKTVVRLWG